MILGKLFFKIIFKVCDIRKAFLQDYSKRDYFEEPENGVFNTALTPEREQLIIH